MLITLTDGRKIPVEMHKIKIVQRAYLLPSEERLNCLRAVGYNTFLLPAREVFLDWLTDSGTNAMSDNQLAAMMVADDAYAGSESFFRLARVVKNVFGYEHPADRVFAFLKYIPSRFKSLFKVSFLERVWKYQGTELFRAEKLYTAQNYQAFLAAFGDSFQEYVYFCPFREKYVISSPLASVKSVYVPKDCLHLIAGLKRKDELQKATLEFIHLLASESGIGVGDFGVCIPRATEP